MLTYQYIAYSIIIFIIWSLLLILFSSLCTLQENAHLFFLYLNIDVSFLLPCCSLTCYKNSLFMNRKNQQQAISYALHMYVLSAQWEWTFVCDVCLGSPHTWTRHYFAKKLQKEKWRKKHTKSAHKHILTTYTKSLVFFSLFLLLYL